MTTYFIENTITQIITALRDNTTGINSKITAINTEKADFTLDSVKDENIVYGPYFDAEVKDLPLIEVLGERTLFSESAQRTVDQEHYISINYAINNQWGDLDKLQKAIYRYGRAIDEVIRTKVWALPVKNGFIEGHDFGVARKFKEGFIGEGSILVRFSTEEV